MNQLVVKSNKLIEAKYKLTTNEQRIILFVLSEKVKRGDTKFGVYQFTADELRSCYGRGMESFERIVDTIKKLRTRSINICDKKKEIDTTWISFAEYDWETKEIIIEFPQMMEPYLLQLKDNFTSYQLHNIVYLKSSYSIRLFELLKQYLSIGSRTFDVGELKELLCVGPEEYTQYGHLKAKVLEVSRKQINANSDIYIKYDPIKKGRKVVALHFYIEPQKVKRLPQIPGLEDPPFDSQEMFDSLIKYGCSPSESSNYIKKYPLEILERNLKYCIEEDGKGKIENKRGFIKSALERDFAYSSNNTTSKKEQDKEKQSEIKLIIQDWKNGNKSEEVEDKIEEFYKSVGHPLYRNWRNFV